MFDLQCEDTRQLRDGCSISEAIDDEENNKTDDLSPTTINFLEFIPLLGDMLTDGHKRKKPRIGVGWIDCSGNEEDGRWDSDRKSMPVFESMAILGR